MHRNHLHFSIFRMRTHPTGGAVNIEGAPVEHFRKAGAHVHLRSLFRKAIKHSWEDSKTVKLDLSTIMLLLKLWKAKRGIGTKLQKVILCGPIAAN